MPRHTSGPKIRGSVRQQVEREQDVKQKKRWADMTEAERRAVVIQFRRPAR